jgi:transcription elongation GreA/GreB family factor
MMTQEIEKEGALLAKLKEEKNLLTAMMQGETQGIVQPGSVVITNQGKFLVGVSIGAVTLIEEKFQTISPSSPIGQMMLDKKTGARFSLHEREFIIEEIL